MKYEFSPNSGVGKKQNIEMPDCEITGNTVHYDLSEGSIMAYSLDEAGNIRNKKGREQENIKLNSYQLSVFEVLKGRDGNSEIFDKADLKGLTEEELLKLVNNDIGGNSNYRAVEAKIEKRSIVVKFWDYGKSKMYNLQVEFKPRFWNSISNFFKNAFKREKSVEKVDEKSDNTAKQVASIQVGKLEEVPMKVVEKATKLSEAQIAQTPKPVEINVENGLLTTFYEKHIPKEYAEHIKKAAKEAGVSENLVKFIILTEGRSKNGKFTADLEPYECKNGVLTIGFGHTNSTKTFEVNEDTDKITVEKAFEILVADIKEHKKSVINSVGKDNYQKLLDTDRESLAEALIDWSFNAGSKRLRTSENVKLNIENKHYFGLATTSLWNEDDPRRSVMRMLYAVDYMKPKDKQKIKKKFLDEEMRANTDSTYYNSIEAKLVGGEKDIVLAIIDQYLSK